MKMSYNELSTNIHVAMLQTWHLLRAKKLTSGDIPNGECWEEFDNESCPKSKYLSKAYPYLETLSKMENKGRLVSPGPPEHLSSLPCAKILSEGKTTGNSGGQHEPAAKPLLVLRQNPAPHWPGWESNGALLALACDIITPYKGSAQHMGTRAQ